MVTVTLPDAAFIGSSASFGSSTDMPKPYKWQWYRNGKEIPGASSAKVYTSWPLRPEDFDAEYHVQVFGLLGDIEESAPVKLSSIFGNPPVVKVDHSPATLDVAGEQYKVVSKVGDIVTLQRIPGIVLPPIQSAPMEHPVPENVLPVPDNAKELPAMQNEPTPTPAEPVPASPAPAEPAAPTEPVLPTPQGGTT